MVGIIISILTFNIIAFKINDLLNRKQIAHIWMFTMAVQAVTETYIDFKYHGYWYLTKEINWWVLLTFTVLIPPVNIIFLNWYPYGSSRKRIILYFLLWEVLMVFYESLTLLPEPWGYFNYGWWELWYSAILNPFLLLIVLKYYKWFIK